MTTSDPLFRLAVTLRAFVLQQCRLIPGIILSGCLAALGSSLVHAQGGSLTPPGAPAPMMKTLQQIEPRTDIAELSGDATAVKIISAPGSYYLTGNLTGASGKDTIRVENISGRVTIDLGGFILFGTGTGRSAILLPAGNVRVTIRNGGIVASTSDPTTLAVGGSCSHVLCENLEITSNGAAVITLGTDGIVDRCRIVGGGITGLDRTIVRDSLISAAGINDVSVVTGTDAQVTGVSFTVGRGQIAVGDRGLVADCQINSGGPPTFFASGVVLQTGAGAVVRNCTVTAGTTVGSGAIGPSSGTLVTGCRVTSAFRDGISASSSDNVTVESCVFQGFGRDGIKLNANARIRDCTVIGNGANGGGIELGAGAVVSGCTVTNNGDAGISTGSNCIIEKCVATGNVTTGILVTDGASLSGCTANSNTGAGIQVGAAASLSGCSAKSNTGAGIQAGSAASLSSCSANSNTGAGIQAGAAASLSGCSALSNGSGGIATGAGATLANCTASTNVGIGLSVGLGSTVSHCTAISNDGTAGIQAGFGCTISHCTARANTSAGTGSFGILTDIECLVLACTVTDTTSTNVTLTSTTGGGISVATASTVRDCTVQGSKGDGIRATNACQIIGNTCNGNGATTGDGAGIHTTFTRNRIEGNTVTSNDRGIDVDSTASLIIKNSASLNTTNYDIAASNRYGPIVDIAVPGSAAVIGNFATSVLTSTDPNANFSY